MERDSPRTQTNSIKCSETSDLRKPLIVALVLAFSSLYAGAESTWDILKNGKPVGLKGVHVAPLPQEQLKESIRLDSILQHALQKPPSPIPVATIEPQSFQLFLYLAAERNLSLHFLKTDPKAGHQHVTRFYSFAQRIRNSQPSLADLMIVSAFEIRFLSEYLSALVQHKNPQELLNSFLELALANLPPEITKETLAGETKASMFYARNLPETLKEYGAIALDIPEDWKLADVLALPFDPDRAVELQTKETLSILRWVDSGLPATEFPKDNDVRKRRALKFYQSDPDGLVKFHLDYSSFDFETPNYIAHLRQRQKLAHILTHWLHLEKQGSSVTSRKDFAKLSKKLFLSAFDGSPIEIDYEKRLIDARSTTDNSFLKLAVPRFAP